MLMIRTAQLYALLLDKRSHCCITEGRNWPPPSCDIFSLFTFINVFLIQCLFHWPSECLKDFPAAFIHSYLPRNTFS